MLPKTWQNNGASWDPIVHGLQIYSISPKRFTVYSLVSHLFNEGFTCSRLSIPSVHASCLGDEIVLITFSLLCDMLPAYSHFCATDMLTWYLISVYLYIFEFFLNTRWEGLPCHAIYQGEECCVHVRNFLAFRFAFLHNPNFRLRWYAAYPPYCLATKTFHPYTPIGSY